MYEKHQDYLHTLGRATSQVKTQETAHASDVDGRLEPFFNMPIYGLMADVLHLRRLASQLDGDNSSSRSRLNVLLHYEAVHKLIRRPLDIDAYVIDNDRTLFSLLAHKYESAIVHLLAQHEIAGIAPTTLRAFQQSYVSTAFRCRFPHCDRLSLGFATVELRLEHEAVHIRRVYCQTESCQYSRIGFAKRSALNGHTRKHHGQSNILLIPAKMRRTTNTGAEVETKSPDLQIIDAGPWQESSGLQLLEDGQQKLLRPDDVLKLRCLPEDEKQKYRTIMQSFWTIFNNNPQGSQANTSARQKLTEWSQKFIGRERQYRAKQLSNQGQDPERGRYDPAMVKHVDDFPMQGPPDGPTPGTPEYDHKIKEYRTGYLKMLAKEAALSRQREKIIQEWTGQELSQEQLLIKNNTEKEATKLEAQLDKFMTIQKQWKEKREQNS